MNKYYDAFQMMMKLGRKFEKILKFSILGEKFEDKLEFRGEISPEICRARRDE